MESISADASASFAVEFRGVSKTFGGTVALRDVDWTVHRGEIHALVGQNGAGKSTIIKILAGYHEPDAGELYVQGHAIQPPYNPWDARRFGLGFFHQNLPLQPGLSIIENLRVGRYAAGPLSPIPWKKEQAEVQRLLARVGVRVDPAVLVKDVPPAERALVGLARAVGDVERTSGDGVLVLDEPTAYLPAQAVERVYEAISRMVSEGMAVILVTHRLDEVVAIADRVTVIRDGAIVGSLVRAEMSEEVLVQMIVGHDVGSLYPPSPEGTGGVALEISGLSGDLVEDVSFTLQQGEVIGLTGLVGMGHDQVPRIIYGASSGSAGRISVGDAVFDVVDMKPHIAREAGICFLPADREHEGGILAATVRENVTMPIVPRFFSRGMLRKGSETTYAVTTLQSFNVHPVAPELSLSSLSGGNQQKVLLGKWLQLEPRVQLLHEPTQGIDVGSRKQVFAAIRDATGAGMGVVIASAEYEDLAGIATRVLVFRNGRIVRELAGENLTKERIIEQCYRSA